MGKHMNVLFEQEFGSDLMSSVIMQEPNKQYLLETAKQSEQYNTFAPFMVARWNCDTIPNPTRTGKVCVRFDPHYYLYNDSSWFVNFADRLLFGYYETSLFAQEEAIVVMHPVLGALRDQLLSLAKTDNKYQPLTHTDDAVTPYVMKGIPRLLDIDTFQIYGHNFQYASHETLDELTTVLHTGTTNLISMAAICVSRPGTVYTINDIEYHLRAAFTAFTAASTYNSTRYCTIHSGNWGCGAFGGNKELMYLIQMLAAQWANVSQLIIHDVDIPLFYRAEKLFNQLYHHNDVEAVIRELCDMRYTWSESNGT